MTSPFVDRVEYQVIGRDTNASQVFRNVADAADAAGDSIGGLGTDLDRVNRSIDGTADRMRALLSSLQDLSASREITITTNVREVLGSIEDNRQIIDLLDDRFENLTVNVTATVNQLIELNDGLTTIDDNRTAVISLGDDVLQLTQNVTATVDSVVALNDGIQTIDDNRAVVIDLGDEVVQLTQNIDATVDSVVELNDGIQTIDDNRAAVITLGDDVLQLTQNIDATVDSVVELNDGIQTIDDNRAAVITLGDDVLTLTQNIDATVDSVVELNDGIATIDDNRSVIVTVDDDFRTLTQDIDATVDSIVNLNDGITTVDDNRTAITGVGDDFRTLNEDIDTTRTVVIRFNDEVARVDDNRAGVIDLGTGFDDLATAIERSRGRVTDLNRDIDNLPEGRDIDNEVDVTRRVVETVSSDRDRLERAGLIAGAVLGHAFLTSVGNAITGGIGRIISSLTGPLVAGFLTALGGAGPVIAGGVVAALSVAALAAATVVANAFTAGLLLALGGGVIAAGLIAAWNDPTLKASIKGLGDSLKATLTEVVKESNFAISMSNAINSIKDGVESLKPQLTALFSAAGPLIQPLVDAMMGFGAAALPGMTEALRNMKPIFDQLVVWMPKLGKTIGDFFGRLSEQSPQLASALGYLFGAVDTVIRVIGGALVVLSELQPAAEFILHWIKKLYDIGILKPPLIVVAQQLWEVLKLLGDIVTVVADGLGSLGDAFMRLDGPLGNVEKVLGRMLGPLGGIAGLALGAGGALGLFGGKSEEARSKVGGLTGALGPAAAAAADQGAKAAGAATENQKLADAVRDALNAANDFIGLGDAQSQMYEAMERGTKRVAEASGKDLKKGIDLSTAAGRENWRALRDIAAGANAAAGDITNMGGSAADAAAVTQVARQKFIEVAGAMGIAAGDAQILADKMFGIPDADPKATLQDKATAGIGGINNKLGALDRYNAMPSVGLLDNATRGIGRIQNLLYQIDGNSATVTVNVEQNGSVSNPLFRAASGGPVFGPGPKGVDSKLYMLAPGEHIMTAQEVDAAGGHAAVTAFRRSLLNKAHSPNVSIEESGVRRSPGGQGVDAHTLRRALEGMTLVIDDRTGRTAQLISRGG